MSDTAHDQGHKPPVNLDEMSVPELVALRDAAEAKRLEKLEEAKAALRVEFLEKAAALGVSLNSVVASRKRGQQARAKVAVKYRGPKGEEWAGRGKPPQWMKDAQKQGRKREEFLIQK